MGQGSPRPDAGPPGQVAEGLVLHGSLGWGEFHPGSDVDVIAVWSELPDPDLLRATQEATRATYDARPFDGSHVAAGGPGRLAHNLVISSGRSTRPARSGWRRAGRPRAAGVDGGGRNGGRLGPARHTGRVLHRHPFLGLGSLAYLAFVGWVTLTPAAAAPTQSELVLRVLARLQRYDELSWLTYDRAEYLANVALFVPVGVFLLLLFGTRLWWLALGAAITLTSFIETVQRGIPGRVPDDRDVAANTMGAVLGIAVAVVLTFPATYRRYRREARQAARQRELAGR